MIESLKKAILDALFPLRCFGCGKSGALLCEECKSRLPRHLPPFCAICAKPLPGGSPRPGPASGGGVSGRGTVGKDTSLAREAIRSGRRASGLCPRCLDSPLAIDGIRSVFRYDDPVRHGILRLKYHGERSLAEPLGVQLGRYVLAGRLPADAIVPVPLHTRRLRERGYNQSLLMARVVSQLTGLKLVDRALVRVKDTPSQVGSASAEERRRNVQGAFESGDANVKGLRLLVIDDVCTTGSTLEACSVALRQAGARSVWGLTLAREV